MGNITIVFQGKLEPWRKYLGIIYACYCSFGATLLALVLYTVFGEIDYSIPNIFTGTIFPITIAIIYIPVIFKPLKKQKLNKILLWSLLALLFVFAMTITCRFLENNLIAWLGYSGLKKFNTEHMNNQLNSNDFLKIFFMISACLIGPFVEEAVYRVCLFATLRKHYRLISHILTALLFGFQHISISIILYNNYLDFLYIFSHMGFSLVMTFLYEKTKTPVPGIIAHMIINIFFIM